MQPLQHLRGKNSCFVEGHKHTHYQITEKNNTNSLNRLLSSNTTQIQMYGTAVDNLQLFWLNFACVAVTYGILVNFFSSPSSEVLVGCNFIHLNNTRPYNFTQKNNCKLWCIGFEGLTRNVTAENVVHFYVWMQVDVGVLEAKVKLDLVSRHHKTRVHSYLKGCSTMKFTANHLHALLFNESFMNN